MKKIGLCVRYNCNNYGSMLQIYATQKAIRDCGYEYEHIIYNKKNLTFIIKNLNRVFNPYFVRGKIMDIQKKKGLSKNAEVLQGNNDRIIKFKEYRDEYIKPYSEVYRGFKSLAKGAKKYSTVMVGSDQLWTPAGLQSKFYNLLFVPDNVKKIAFATSFGVTEIPKKQINLTKNYLNRIEYLSVRELSGAKIIKKLTGRDVLVALDPTLLYSSEEWNNFFPLKKMYSDNYIFAYFLGTDIKYRKFVEEFAKSKGLKIITCPAMDEFVEYDLNFGDERAFKIDPIDFLNLIRGAEYIFTDSFHGTIFSILNHKKFITFNRYSDSIRSGKNSRIDSLCEQLGLQNRHFKGDKFDFSLIEEDIDYVSVENKLSILREETWSFLKNALNA